VGTEGEGLSGGVPVRTNDGGKKSKEKSLTLKHVIEYRRKEMGKT
jgi:hypothetical protein